MDRRKVRNPPARLEPTIIAKSWMDNCSRCELPLGGKYTHCPVCNKWAGILRDEFELPMIITVMTWLVATLCFVASLICFSIGPEATEDGVAQVLIWAAPLGALLASAISLGIGCLGARHAQETERLKEKARNYHG